MLSVAQMSVVRLSVEAPQAVKKRDIFSPNLVSEEDEGRHGVDVVSDRSFRTFVHVHLDEERVRVLGRQLV
jgi:hypothetical protein